MYNDSCSSKSKFTLTDEMKSVVSSTPFLALATVSKEGSPHLVIIGNAKVRDDDKLVFDIHHMSKTLGNIAQNGILLVVATKEYTGYRFTGIAHIEDRQVVLLVEKAEPLL